MKVVYFWSEKKGSITKSRENDLLLKGTTIFHSLKSCVSPISTSVAYSLSLGLMSDCMYHQ